MHSSSASLRTYGVLCCRSSPRPARPLPLLSPIQSQGIYSFCDDVWLQNLCVLAHFCRGPGCLPCARLLSTVDLVAILFCSYFFCISFSFSSLAVLSVEARRIKVAHRFAGDKCAQNTNTQTTNGTKQTYCVFVAVASHGRVLVLCIGVHKIPNASSQPKKKYES